MKPGFQGYLARARRKIKMAKHRARVTSPEEQLVADVLRDPEGEHWPTGPNDRRIPLWFGSDLMSNVPTYLQDEMRVAFQGIIRADDLPLIDLRVNWYEQQVELVRWLRTWESDPTGIGRVVLDVVQLDRVAYVSGWQRILAKKLRETWRANAKGVVTEEQVAATESMERREQAQRIIHKTADLVATGRASPEVEEMYDWASKVLYGDRVNESLEQAKEMQEPMKRILKL